MLNLKRYRLRASSCPDIYRNSMTTIAEEKVQWYAGLWDFWDLLVDMFDFSHFADPKYLVFALSNFLLYTWYDVPYVYLTDNATQLGFGDKESSILISIIGIINMLGEVSLSYYKKRLKMELDCLLKSGHVNICIDFIRLSLDGQETDPGLTPASFTPSAWYSVVP